MGNITQDWCREAKEAGCDYISAELSPEARRACELFLLVVVFIRVLNRVVRDENREESGWDT